MMSTTATMAAAPQADTADSSLVAVCAEARTATDNAESSEASRVMNRAPLMAILLFECGARRSRSAQRKGRRRTRVRGLLPPMRAGRLQGNRWLERSQIGEGVSRPSRVSRRMLRRDMEKIAAGQIRGTFRRHLRARSEE